MSKKYTIHHADHGVSIAQLDHVKAELDEVSDGFFIKEITIPPTLGTVGNALYGPASGDAPIGEDEVTHETRGDRPYPDRLVDKPARPVDYVQVIGIRDGDDYTIFTVHGGPLALQHPEDPNNKDVEASIAFWNEHALANR